MPAPHRYAYSAALGFAALTAIAALTPAARAGIPDPAQSTVQNVIVGSWDGLAMPTAISPCGTKHGESFIVIVRDAAGLPVGGAILKIGFAGSGLSITPLQNSGVTVDCASHTLVTSASPSGVAKFTPHFGGYLDSPGIPVSADGILLGFVTAASPDYDGDGRITLSDFTTFAGDYLSPSYFARSDFDNCPTNKLADLSYFGAEYMASHGTQLSPICPP